MSRMSFAPLTSERSPLLRQNSLHTEVAHPLRGGAGVPLLRSLHLRRHRGLGRIHGGDAVRDNTAQREQQRGARSR